MDGNKVTIGVLIGVIVLGLWYFNTTPETGAVTPPVPGAPAVPGAATQCAQNPSYTYSAVNAFSTTVVGGTDQIRADARRPTSSLANPEKGVSLDYWKNNASYFCELTSAPLGVECGAHALEAQCYENSSTYTITSYEEPAHTALTATTTTGAGTTNVSIAASGQATIQMTLQGQYHKSIAPFGGCYAIEYPNSITSATVTGALSSATACPYKWTYSVASTSNTFQTFALPSNFDKDALGDIKTANIQIQNGASDITAGNLVLTIQPADYYVTNAGKIVLGIEEDQNQATTKTAGTTTEALAIS